MTKAVLLPVLLTILALRSLFAVGQQATGAEADHFESIANQLANAGRYSDAIRVQQYVLETRKHTSGEDSAPCARALTNLGMLYGLIGQYDEAEPLLHRVLEVQRQLGGPDSPEYATALNDLGMVYLNLKLYDWAEPRFRDALSIRERKLDHNDADYALSLDNLGWTYGAMGQYDRAEPLFKEALNVDILAKRTSESVYGTHLRNLAWLYFSQHQYSNAEPLMGDVLEIDRRFVGKDIPGWVANQDIQDMDTLGLIDLHLGHYRKAESTLLLAQEALQKTKLENHLLYASVLTHLGLLYQSTGRTRDALHVLEVAMKSEQADLDRGIYGIRTYIDSIRFSLVGLVSVAAASHNDEATKLAFDWVVRRKALGLDGQMAVARVKRSYSDDPEIYQRDERIRELKRRIHKLVLSPQTGANRDDQQRELIVSRAAMDRLQDELDHQFSGALNWASETDLETIRRRLPLDSALIEFLLVPEYNFNARGKESLWTSPRYVAFVLSSVTNEQPRFIDIGDAKEIDRKIGEVRDKIEEFKGLVSEREAETEYQRVSRNLYASLFRRSGLRQALGRATRVYVSPDGELSRIAFEALNDENVPDRYLAEVYTFIYLPAARYLPAAAAKGPTATSLQLGPGTVVFAAPDYNLKASERRVRALTLLANRDQVSTPRSSGKPSLIGRVTWEPLQGTIREAEDVKSALEKSTYGPVQVFEGPDALEEVFRLVHGPRILHVATHGYFLPNPHLDRSETESGGGFTGTLGKVQESDDPFLRSGLVFAGANLVNEADGDDSYGADGWMTAADVALMDLTGTDLVVLSSCDTGLGDVKDGDGVQGLQQSFLTVGARSLVMTLYEVPDEEARQFMRNFYVLLAAGEDKATALHNAQMSLISERRKQHGAAHPYFWGSFIFVG